MTPCPTVCSAIWKVSEQNSPNIVYSNWVVYISCVGITVCCVLLQFICPRLQNKLQENCTSHCNLQLFFFTWNCTLLITWGYFLHLELHRTELRPVLITLNNSAGQHYLHLGRFCLLCFISIYLFENTVIQNQPQERLIVQCNMCYFLHFA